jgi:hypothetical protein
MATELEILDGERVFSKTQELFVGAPAETLYSAPVECGWYDEYTSPYRGAFMLVAEGGNYMNLVGEFVRVSYKQKSVNVYCVASEIELPTPIAIARRPYLSLSRLTVPSLEVYTQVLV